MMTDSDLSQAHASINGDGAQNTTNDNKSVTASVRGLSKKYSKNAEYAVKDIGFELLSGEIVGLLGANGAGKSTTLKCITGMVRPDAGEVLLCGKSLKRNPVEAKSNMSFVTDSHSVFEKMTGMQYVSFMADIFGVPSDIRQKRFEELEKRFCIGDKMSALISSYSHGTKQKICMMGSLIHQPKLWILDEPMLGLDPPTTRAVVELMREYAALGNTILFSSHNLDVVTKVCDRVLVIRCGRLECDINLKNALSQNPNFSLEAYFDGVENDSIDCAEVSVCDGGELPNGTTTANDTTTANGTLLPDGIQSSNVKSASACRQNASDGAEDKLA